MRGEHLFKIVIYLASGFIPKGALFRLPALFIVASKQPSPEAIAG